MLQGFDAVVVTGGSSGIGKSFIEQIAKIKPDLLFCNLSRRVPDINSVQLKLRHFPCDLGHPDEVERAAGEIISFLRQVIVRPPRILLINNSGFGAYGCFPEPNLAHQTEMVDVNVRAVVQLTGLLLPLLQEGRGAVINVASTAAFQPTAYLATYGATKAFLLHWSLALHQELKPYGVPVLAVCPGPTATSFFKRAGMKEAAVPDVFGQTPGQVTAEALRAFAAGHSLVVTGWRNRLLASVSSKLPKVAAAWLGAKLLARFRLKQAR